MPTNKFFILDAYALIFRAYYAFIKNPRFNSKGLNTSAIFGFTNTLDEILKKEQPSHVAVCFDAPAATFRKDIYPAYKANRDATPEDIKKSVPYIKNILAAFNIPIFEQAGYEADDLAGSLAKKFASPDIDVFLMTSDKDYLQLLDDNINIYKPRTNKKDVEIIGVNEFKQKFGLQSPLQYIDILALAGDAADNVPGVPGIGEKTALKLLIQYKDIDGVYENICNLKGKLKEKVEQNKDMAYLSKKLVTIKTDIEINTSEDDLKIKQPNEKQLADIFSELEFKNTSTRVLKKNNAQQTLWDSTKETRTENTDNQINIKTISPDYHLVETQYEFEELIKELENSKEFAFDTETNSVDANNAEIVGISFCTKKNTAYYVHIDKTFKIAKKTLEKFTEVFDNQNIAKIGQNLKYDLIILKNYGINVRGTMFDTMIAHSLLYPELKHNLDYLAETYLNYKTISITELIGKKGLHQKNMSSLPASKIKDYAAEDADIAFQLKDFFKSMLERNNLSDIFYNVEMPLIKVLTNMEFNGIILNKSFLAEYRNKIHTKLTETENKIYQLSGGEFNLNSPKQLGDILFKKLNLSDKPKLTKTKQFATDENELKKYEGKHEIIEQILDYRSLNKLLSTYIDALPKLINPKTGRIHTSFNQTITRTGRLSSNNPNLQNIPIRTSEGRQIRRAFIPQQNYVFIDADYSQIELRLMAHLSQDFNMIEAFKSNIDIHTQTAAKLFNIEIDKVEPQMRYQAKTANFAMIYGSSAFGLSRTLNISPKEAKTLITNYFDTYPGVKKYISEQIAKVRNEQIAVTLMGRKRKLTEINSRNSLIRSNAERNAVNTPIQGSAADIIKIAMTKIQTRIDAEKLRTKMLLQVHDELLFEVPLEEEKYAFSLIKTEMENAVELSIPLAVDILSGKNWAEVH